MEILHEIGMYFEGMDIKYPRGTRGWSSFFEGIASDKVDECAEHT